MILRRLTVCSMAALLLGASSCGGRTADDGATDPLDDLTWLCTKNCVKPVCAGNVDPSPDYGELCESSCDERVEQAQADDCLAQYEALLTCLDETSCTDYYLWYDESAGAPCSELEAEFVAVCPSIRLRDGD